MGAGARGSRTRTTLTLLAIALLAGADALILQSEGVEDGSLVACLVGTGLAFGLAIGEWWAGAASLMLIPLLLLLPYDGDRELTTLYVVIVIGGLLVSLQAAGMLAGVLLRKSGARP